MLENFAPTAENPRTQAEIATQQFLGIQNLYKGIVTMTTMEQRREIARHYSWENNNGKINCKRQYTLEGVFHNMETLINPKNAYDLADEFLVTEAGLVRDTLYFHNYWENFNRLAPTIDTEDNIPTTVNIRSITQALEMSLKYEVLGRENFRNELIGRGAANKRAITVRDARGELVENAETRFLDIMNELENNLVLLAQNPKTRDLYFQAINDLTYRTNQKLKRLGFEKGLAAATTGLFVAPAAIGSCLPGVAAVVAVGSNLIPPAAILAGGFRDAKIRDAEPDSPLVRVIDRQPITPQPTKPVPLPSAIIKESPPIKSSKDTEQHPVKIKSEPLRPASEFNYNLGIPEALAIPKGIQEPTAEVLEQLARVNLAVAELGNQQIEQTNILAAPVLPEGATPISVIGDYGIRFGEVCIERRHNFWEFDITIGDITYGGIEASEIENTVRELQRLSGLPEACPDLSPYLGALRNRWEHKPEDLTVPTYFLDDVNSNRKPNRMKKTLGQMWKVIQKFLP